MKVFSKKKGLYLNKFRNYFLQLIIVNVLKLLTLPKFLYHCPKNSGFAQVFSCHCLKNFNFAQILETIVPPGRYGYVYYYL